MLDTIAPLDWVAGAVLLASLVLGAWRGLVYELLSVLSWVAAFVLAQWFGPAVAAWLPISAAGEAVRFAAGFALVFIAVVFAGGLVAWLGSKLAAAAGMRPADRAFGALFGLMRGIMVVLALAVLVHTVDLEREPWWNGSMTAGISSAMLQGLKPVLPETFGKYLPG